MQHTPVNTESIEIGLLMEGIYRRWGYDFRSYAPASLKRQITKRMHSAGLSHISGLLPRVLHDKEFLDSFVLGLSITVTEMFRDPEFFQAVRQHLISLLKTYSFVKIWHAGCATGEEVYSMAILLQEEGLLDRIQIYATDFNGEALDKAKTGIYPVERLEAYAANYLLAGGAQSLSAYYHALNGSAKMTSNLMKHITFAHHNLATDGVFGEMNMVVCRNVLIYFDRSLQNRALTLFENSLCHRGILCLGNKETLDFSPIYDRFEEVAGKEKIYRRINRVAHARLTMTRTS